MSNEELPPEARAMLDNTRKMREMYGYPPDPPEPLTLEQMKAGEHRNAEHAIADALNRYGGTRAGQDANRLWFSHNPVHDRDLPEFAYATIGTNCWAPEDAEALAIIAWSQPEWPGQHPAGFWRAIFTRVAESTPLPLCSDDDCPLPHDQPLRVYRAAFSSAKRGLAWTTDRNTATWFAARGDMSGKRKRMRMWTTEVPADRVYAHITGRSESEIVCDVRGLRLTSEPLHIPPNAETFDRHGGHWWVTCTHGHRHYGEHGAAGLLLRHVDTDGTIRLLLHQRGAATDHAGTWGYPGGAVGEGESPEDAARRETAEEASLTNLPAVVDEYVLDHGDWTYTTLIVDMPDQSATTAPSWEGGQGRWATAAEIAHLPLVTGADAAIAHALAGAP